MLTREELDAMFNEHPDFWEADEIDKLYAAAHVGIENRGEACHALTIALARLKPDNPAKPRLSGSPLNRGF